MAEISARGAVAVERHTSQNGTQYLLRSDGKILHKYLPSDGWSIFRTQATASRSWAWIKQHN